MSREKLKDGQLVVCVDDEDCFPRIVRGEYYRIAHATHTLVHLYINGQDYHFAPSRFRPATGTGALE